MEHATRNTQHGPHEEWGTQYALCLSTSRSPSAKIDRELQIAGEAGFTCVELWASTLETYLTRHPVVWLDLQMRQQGIHNLVVNGLAPLSQDRGTEYEDVLVSQARFLELCTQLDTLGGAIIVLHPPAIQEVTESGPEETLRALRACAELAAPFEISLVFEFRADSAIPTVEAAQDLVQRAAASNLRLSLSTREWCVSKRESRALDALASGQLALVHVDSPLSRPSEAATDPEPPARQSESALTLALCEHLMTAGFRGPYCLPCAPEPGVPPKPGTSLERARAARQAALEALTLLYEGKLVS